MEPSLLPSLAWFAHIAQHRSFTKAAKRLNISQSAVSEQVKLLEEEAGFPLFERTPRGIDVTDRGRTFLSEASRIVGDVLSLTDTARRLRGAALDTFTIGMGSGMAQIFMPRLFGKLEEMRSMIPERRRRRAKVRRLPKQPLSE